MKYKYVIVGGGPTGLGAAYRLLELGITDFIVLEKENYVGGLATSFVDEKGFTWDIGGHVQFSHYKYFDDLMIKALGNDGWLTHERESWVWIKNTFVPYPFQNNIRHLPLEDQLKCIKGLVDLYKNGAKSKVANFKEWILNTFGQGLADVFMIPYNFKVWAYPAEMMNSQWVGERVAVTDLSKMIENILLEKDDYSWGPNNLFHFPKKGGTGAIWKAVGDLIGEKYFHLNSNVDAIDINQKSVQLSNGESVEYEFLLNTMPLDIFTSKCQDWDNKLIDLSQNLLHSSTHIIGIGLKGSPPAHLKKKCWMYFPESNSPYYRITVFSNYSPENVPDINNQWSLMVEISESPYKPVDVQHLMEDTIKGLLEDNMIENENQIESKFYFSTNYGYPTPSIDRDNIVNQVLPKLQEHNIYSRGRFGAWKYEVANQDHSMMQGVEWANLMVLGIPELTLPFPNTANAMYGK